MVQSIRIDFVCRPELFICFIAAAGRAHWKRGCSFTHTEVIPYLQERLIFPLFLLPPSTLKRLPTCPLTGFAATRCCFTTHHHRRHLRRHQSSRSITVSTCICQTNDPPSPCSLDKYSPSLSLSLSLLIYLSVSTYRRVSAGCLQFKARRSGSRDLEGIGKTQLNGRSCLCLTLPT